MPFALNPTFQSPKSKQSPSKKSLPSTSSQTLNTSRTQKTLTPQYLEKKVLRTLSLSTSSLTQNQRWTAKRQKLREQHVLTKEEQQLKQCTFQPSLNPQISFNGSNSSPFLKRQMDWLSKKEKRIEQLARQTEKKLNKQCSFKPKISSKSYAILNQAFKTSRTFNEKTERNQQKNKTFERQKNGGCYRQIHIKQGEYKELQKVNSVHHFPLMTERRFAKKMGLKEDEDANFGSARKKIHEFKLSEAEDYIENIVIKTQEQNTFDSFTSLDLKTARKNENQVEPQMSRIENQAGDKNEENVEQVQENEEIEDADENQESKSQNLEEREDNQQDQQ